MISFTFTVPGSPIAKGRARITTVGGFARAYTPAKTRTYEATVRHYAKADMAYKRIGVIHGPIKVEVKAFIEIPASWSKKKRAGAIDGSVLPVSRPDLDNYVKAALDGMNEVVFNDDSQIVHLIATKIYSDDPRLEISVQGQE